MLPSTAKLTGALDKMMRWEGYYYRGELDQAAKDVAHAIRDTLQAENDDLGYKIGRENLKKLQQGYDKWYAEAMVATADLNSSHDRFLEEANRTIKDAQSRLTDIQTDLKKTHEAIHVDQLPTLGEPHASSAPAMPVVQSPTMSTPTELVKALAGLHAMPTAGLSKYDAAALDGLIVQTRSRYMERIAETRPTSSPLDMDAVQAMITSAVEQQAQRYGQLLCGQEVRHQEAIKELREQLVAKDDVEQLADNKLEAMRVEAEKTTLAVQQQAQRYEQLLYDQEARHQQAIKELRGQLVAKDDVEQLVESKVKAMWAEGEEDWAEVWIEKAESLTKDIKEVVDKAFKRHEEILHDHKVMRHDILDHAHSLLEVKSTVSAMQDLVDKEVSVPVAAVTTVLVADQPKLPTTFQLEQQQLKPFSPHSVTSTAGTSLSAVSQSHQHDDIDSTVSELSDDSFCVMEPNDAEVAASRATDKTPPPISPTTSCSSSSSSSTTSTIFDNNGPLSVSPTTIRDLLFAAMTCQRGVSKRIKEALRKGDTCAPRDIAKLALEHLSYDYEDPAEIRVVGATFWTALTTICKEAEAASESLTEGAGSRPPLWEGGGPQGLGGDKGKGRAAQ